MHALVEDASEGRLRVWMESGEPVILHPAHLLRQGPGGCVEVALADVPVGAAVSFQADAWIHTNPSQAWPEQAVVA